MHARHCRLKDPSSTFPLLVDPQSLPATLLHPVLALGNFDGLHRGHQAVIEAALDMGGRLGRPVALLTFEPHPRDFFSTGLKLFRLTDVPAKAELSRRLGLDAMIVLEFDAALAARPAGRFIEEWLVGRLTCSGVAVGFDFQFGQKRSGTPASLAEAGRSLGFEVVVVPERQEHGEAISSTLIREKLGCGEVEAANVLLGHAWFVIGTVLHGRKVGRTIGYPTLNLRLADNCGLKHGIYAVRVRFDGASHDGVASFGRRPTFDDGAPLLEVFVFDFDGDLYGRSIEVSFASFLREEERFDTVDALVAQMDLDSATARHLLR